MHRKPTYQANQPTQPLFMMRQEPAGKKTTIETEVYIPAMHATIITLAWALPCTLIAVITVLLRWLPWYVIILTPLTIGAIIFPVTITRYIKQQRDLLWKREEKEYSDLDRDGHIGQPPPTFKIEVQQHNGRGHLRSIANIDFGVEEAKALQFVREILAGAPITEGHWTGHGRPFSKREYNPLRDLLIAKHMLEWRNPTAPAQGVVLTDYGREAFEQIIEQEAS